MELVGEISKQEAEPTRGCGPEGRVAQSCTSEHMDMLQSPGDVGSSEEKVQ